MQGAPAETSTASEGERGARERVERERDGERELDGECNSGKVSATRER